MSGEVWVFGYGSLIWRPSFLYSECRPAALPHFARRFWQGSMDHRGLPDAPGRVVTLVPDPGGLCEGVAFRIDAEEVDDVLSHLDGRESGGYERTQLTLRLAANADRSHPADVHGIVYVAAEGNPNYLGPAPLEEMAAQIRGAVGPSGPNPEYLLRLADALRERGIEDPHVFALESLVRGT